MILNPAQISAILSEVDKNTLLFVAGNVGVDVLSPEDISLLRRFGINHNQLYSEFPLFTQSFYFGRLAQLLGEKNTSILGYSDLREYLKRHQYQPLTSLEKSVLAVAKRKTYGHIKDLGNKQKGDVVNAINRKEYEKIIGDAVESAVSNRQNIREVVSQIGHKTGDWQRDLGRIAETEMQSAYNWGTLTQIMEDYGEDVFVYKQVYQGACRHCIRLYLTSGLGSKPILFKIKDLVANGNNIGLKVVDWKATVGPIHPFCRCSLFTCFPGQVWDDEKKMFMFKKDEDAKPWRKSKIKVKIGERELLV